jgi:hypothetical protein
MIIEMLTKAIRYGLADLCLRRITADSDHHAARLCLAASDRQDHFGIRGLSLRRHRADDLEPAILTLCNISCDSLHIRQRDWHVILTTTASHCRLRIEVQYRSRSSGEAALHM